MTTTTVAPAGEAVAPAAAATVYMADTSLSLAGWDRIDWVQASSKAKTPNGTREIFVLFGNDVFRNNGTFIVGNKSIKFRGNTGVSETHGIAWKSASLADRVTCTDTAIKPIVGLFPPGASVAPQIDTHVAEGSIALGQMASYSWNLKDALQCTGPNWAVTHQYNRAAFASADFGKTNGGTGVLAEAGNHAW